MDRRLIAIAAATALAPAQTQLVLPQSHAQLDGTTATSVPFGRGGAVRVQCLYDPMLFAAAGNVTAIAFRLDGGQSAASKQVDCELRLSTSPRALVAMGADFAGNRGGDEVVVLPRQLLALPASTATATPSPFLAPIALAVPFHYDPALGPLLLEVTVFGQPPGSYVLDATFVCNSPEVLVGPPACVPAQGQPLRVESATQQVLWGRPWLARALDAPAGAPVVLGLGDNDVMTGGVPLPIPLDAIGATGCFLSIDATSLWFQVAQPDGTATFAFTVPNQPSLLGYWAYFQAGVFAPAANAAGLATSQAKRVQVCGFEPVARLWAASTTAAVGSLEIGTAPVIQLTLQ